MGQRTAILAFALVVLACPAITAAQGRDLKEENKRRDQQINDRGRYLAMLEAYRAGDTAKSVDLLALDPEWDETRLRMLLKRLATPDPLSALPEHVWRLASMLHIDVALRLSPRLGEPPSMTPLHLGVALELIRLGIRQQGDAFRDLAERIYVALARLMIDRLATDAAERVLISARERLKDRPAILYESGTLAELLATDFALLGTVRSPELRRGTEGLLDALNLRRNGHLNDAADWLRQAAELDPANDLLQVHLGRVLALRGNDDEAATILDRATRSTDDATAYLAWMFTGGLRERQERLEDAMAAYRAAMMRFPPGQAAYIGLSEVLQRTGTGEEAREVLATKIFEKLGPTREPLWWYFAEPPGVAERRLEAVRREVRQ